MGVRRLTGWAGGGAERVWYVSYGSNMCAERFGVYLRGGRAPGGRLAHPGCRDDAAPAGDVALELAGRLYFATESAVWGGGRGFYDPAAPGRVLARGYDITREQFRDVAAQEMYREPGEGPSLDEVLAVPEAGPVGAAAPAGPRVRRVVCGDGRYETLLCLGALDGRPALTFTAPWSVRDVVPLAPSPVYLRQFVTGLTETGAWGGAEIERYLEGSVRGGWGDGTGAS
ncbi:histone deacetylase [Streptomyces sp. NPDC007088]|uniref:histone deacetylase n=1 Tax=Streptomyces sp. NPDC007088 TaxID=3364773 RepID=UPI0036AA8989